MMRSENDAEIFELLEKAGKETLVSTAELLLPFEFDESLFLLLFCPGKNFRQTLLFRIELKDLQREVRSELIPALMDLPDQAEFASLKTRALEWAESIISGRKMDVGYFDAH
ncbi:MAG TPA: hypothetical protein VL651_10830 [Bacteroidia bacterium]|jgi:hypothetical protein|nr:hypothetical protein [Bacteroidia bacterium]